MLKGTVIPEDAQQLGLPTDSSISALGPGTARRRGQGDSQPGDSDRRRLTGQRIA